MTWRIPYPGLCLCLAIATISQAAIAWGWSPVVVALAIGLALGQALPDLVLSALGPGLDVAKKVVLRVGVVLYAAHIDFTSLADGGLQILVIDLFVLVSTFALAMKLGPRLGLSGAQTALIGAGSSICGVSAILATATVVRARGEEVAVAVATVTLFGLAAFALHPVLWRLNGELHVLGGGAAGYGVYIGSTVHDLAQVVATASAIEPTSIEPALIAKMTRVAMLAPFLALLARHARIAALEGAPTEGVDSWKAAMLLPALCLAAAVIGTVAPRGALTWADPTAGLCLATAVAALGMATRLDALKHAGRQALLLGAALLTWLLVGGALIHVLVERLR